MFHVSNSMIERMLSTVIMVEALQTTVLMTFFPEVGTRGGEIVKIKRPTTLNFGLRYRTKDDSHSKEDSLLVPSPQQAIVTGRPPIGYLYNNI